MNKKEKISIFKMVWLFLFGGLLGFILETLWYFIKHGVWINKQGLLYGPFKPIYGFGIIFIVLFMYPFKEKNVFFKFGLGTLLGSAFEYFGSLFQEFVFGTSTWNYSNFNYNIAGRIYLPYCLVWGVIAILCIDYLYPFFCKLLAKVPKKVGKTCSILATIFLILDISLTVLATVAYSNRSRGKDIKCFKIVDKMYPDSYMQKKFPKLRVIKK